MVLFWMWISCLAVAGCAIVGGWKYKVPFLKSIAWYLFGICAIPIAYLFVRGLALAEFGFDPEMATPVSVYIVSFLAAWLMVWSSMRWIRCPAQEERFTGEELLRSIGAAVGPMVLPIVATKLDPNLVESIFVALLGGLVGFGFICCKMPELKPLDPSKSS
jgi:hypothetical protein